MTSDGREFKYLNHKRVNGTFEPISDAFKTGFVELVSDAITDNRVRLLFYMGIGGSHHKSHPNRTYTAVQLREAVFNFVFDFFYTPTYEDLAKDYQERKQRRRKGQGQADLWFARQ